MDAHQLEQIDAALQANRQDDEALTLYWRCLQEAPSPPRDAFLQTLLNTACQCLYEAWNTRNAQESIHELVDWLCRQTIEDSATLHLVAKGEFRAKRDAHALRLYDRLLTQEALTDEGFRNLKMICFRHTPLNEFRHLLLQRCVAHAPDDQALIRFLFSQYALQPDYSEAPFAGQVYQKLLEFEPDNLMARCKLCEWYYQQMRYDEAIEAGELGFQCAPHYPELVALLAKAHYQKREYGKVVNYCKQLLAKHPGRVEMQVLLATVYARNSLTTNEAIRTYQQALQQEPDNVTVRLALFRAYLRKLMTDEAIHECEQLIACLNDTYEPSEPGFRAPVKEMIAEFERVLRRSPGDLAVYLITAKLFEYIGHFHKALIYYRTILQFPLDEAMITKLISLLETLTTFKLQNPHLYLYLGLLYHKVGRPEAAKRAFRAAMYSDLDEREVDDILVRHDSSIRQYPPVLVMLAHHRIVTKDILEGLVQTFRQPDIEDWNGVIWVLQELYDIHDLLLELRQVFNWDSFNELYEHIIPLFAQNGSRFAIQLLEELLSHSVQAIRLYALEVLLMMPQPMAVQCVVDAATENPYPEIRLAIAQAFAEEPNEQTTYHLMSMLHDEDKDVCLCVVRALQQREVTIGPLREALFVKQDPEVRMELIRLFAHLRDPEEAVFLAHLFNDLVEKRYAEGGAATGTAKVYTRLKKLIGYGEANEEVQMLALLVRVLGDLQVEHGMYSLIALASRDPEPTLRLSAIKAIGQIGSPLGVSALQDILHASSESQDIRNAAKAALELIIEGNG